MRQARYSRCLAVSMFEVLRGARFMDGHGEQPPLVTRLIALINRELPTSQAPLRMLHAGVDLGRRKLGVRLLSGSGKLLDQLAMPPEVESLRKARPPARRGPRRAGRAVVGSMTGARARARSLPSSPSQARAGRLKNRIASTPINSGRPRRSPTCSRPPAPSVELSTRRVEESTLESAREAAVRGGAVAEAGAGPER